MSRGFASNSRIGLLAFGVLLSFGVLGVRLVDLHVFAGPARLRSANRARSFTEVLPAQRGEITDALGIKLAMNVPEYQFGVDPQVVRPADEAKWPELARLLQVPLDELEAIFRRKVRGVAAAAEPGAADVTIKLRIGSPAPEPAAAPAVADGKPEALAALTAVAAPANAAPAANPEEDPKKIRWAKLGSPVQDEVRDAVMALGIKGVYANQAYRRIYPQQQLAAHLIGYVNKGTVPVAGLEAAYDFYLRGLNGWREGERDGRAREMTQFRTTDVAPRDGYDLRLTLDSAIQKFVEDELGAIATQFQPAAATIIVSDARTGFLLGLGNYPTFNLNAYNLVPADRQASMKNIAVTDQLDPGSTFKIVTLAGAIEEGLVTNESRFDTSRHTTLIDGREIDFMPDDHRVDGPMSVSQIIAVSSNNGTAQIGLLLGKDRLYGYARAFGFGERTNLGFGGEISGQLRRPETWRGQDFTRIPAGYSVSATPLQIHYAMGTIASGGLLFQPQVVQEIRNPAGKPVFVANAASRRRVISQSTARTMAQLLMGVASPGGTAAAAAIEGYQVAGKTGTARKLINGRYSDTNHVGSFTGFFPATDPQLVITVIVDDAQVPGGKVAYGATVAVPSFHRLAEKLIAYRNIRPPGGAPLGGQRFALQGGGR
jgi:cell division protein FtsI (penicillin-binding protein 3)